MLFKEELFSCQMFLFAGVLRKTNVFPVVSVMLAFSGAVFVGAGLFWVSKKHAFSLVGGVNLVVSGKQLS